MGNSSALKRGTARTQFASRGLGNGSGFGAKSDLRSGELVVGLAGDSTGDESAEWFSRGFDMWLAARPWVSCVYNIWNDATGSYTTSTKQTSNVPVSTVFNDTFTRTASDLYGTTPDLGQPWTGGGTAPASWSINGTKAVALATSTGVLQAVHGTAGDVTVTLTGVTINSATMRGTLSLFGKQVSANTQVYLYVGIDSSGNSSMGIWKNINGVSAGVVFGGTAPLPASSTTTFNMSISITGTAVSGTVNGVTVNGTLSGLEAQLLSPSTQAAFQATPSTMAGMTVDQFAVTAQPGMQNLRLYNGSKAGSRLDYQALRLGKMYPEPMDVLFVSSAHNYTTDDANSYVAKVQQFLENFRNRRPESGVVLVSQNPEFPPSTGHQLHNQRIMALRMLAAEYGYGYLPAAEEFKSLPDGGKYLTRSDGVHPNGSVEVADPNNGSYLWATVAKRYLDSLASPLMTGVFGFTFTIDPGAMRAGDGLGVAANSALYMRVRDPALVSKIGLTVTVQSGNISVGIYRNLGVGRAAVPGQQIATTGAIACPAVSYNEISLPTPVQVQAGDWIAISADNATAKFWSSLSTGTPSSMGLGRQYTQAVHPLPATPSSLTATLGNTICLLGI